MVEPREGAAWAGAWPSEEVGGGRVKGALGSDSLPHPPPPRPAEPRTIRVTQLTPLTGSAPWKRP